MCGFLMLFYYSSVFENKWLFDLFGGQSWVEQLAPGLAQYPAEETKELGASGVIAALTQSF